MSEGKETTVQFLMRKRDQLMENKRLMKIELDATPLESQKWPSLYGHYHKLVFSIKEVEEWLIEIS